ncbi:bifunctional oligoribonuclease/PAP phosphatase NrnA [Salinimicrobium sp. MT39]|uniref:Bifunctional oligoribonuclease/PAP phosphatase NrnA n=1 Tax=Salinimicrobium profundisediminis TaxID=2994553 RepID=A0A9X3CZK7_9FLAO|nr:bifunctional oligoribonuclease/PAP phosphatase NrnA [Salinimicrobium profundisediminis]MCX2839605.1 bifunctional oligoribonuclease/PAP phosphatase NrnA [Salinimicrobium profundisediminis]
MTNEDISKIKELLEGKKKIVIVPHKGPDGDAMGSTLALKILLEGLGHYVNLIAPNDYPNFLKWMPYEKETLLYDRDTEKCEKIIAEADVIFTLDFNHLSRAGDMYKPLQEATAAFVMIDHHQQPDDYADVTYSDVTMCSTCQMVYHFIENIGLAQKITPQIATCLYTGIMTDTGSFRYRSTTSLTHRVIADLIEKGADNTSIHENVFDTSSYGQLQLLGCALQNLRVVEGLRTAYITLSQEELDRHNFKKGDTEGFVNYGLSLEGIVFAAIFIENEAEKIVKISFRSKGTFSVNEFARRYFEGGGHTNAAGGKSDLSLQETVERFISILPTYKTNLAL